MSEQTEEKQMPKPVIEPGDVGEMKLIVGSYYEVQKTRIQLQLRAKMLDRDYGRPEEFTNEFQQGVEKELLKVEKDLKKRMEWHLSGVGIYVWLNSIKGIGPVLAGGLIAYIQDIERFDTVSKLWKYGGWAVYPDGTIQRRKKGEKLDYNPKLKQICWKIGESFVKIGDFYRERYEEYRADEDENHPDLSKGHRYARAKRRTVKLFLSHLWEKWRELEGLETGEPYAIEHMDEHTHKIEPPE